METWRRGEQPPPPGRLRRRLQSRATRTRRSGPAGSFDPPPILVAGVLVGLAIAKLSQLGTSKPTARRAPSVERIVGQEAPPGAATNGVYAAGRLLFFLV